MRIYTHIHNLHMCNIHTHLMPLYTYHTPIIYTGELFKKKMLRANIMHDCIQLLIGKRDEVGEWVGWKEQVSVGVHVYILLSVCCI